MLPKEPEGPRPSRFIGLEITVEDIKTKDYCSACLHRNDLVGRVCDDVTFLWRSVTCLCHAPYHQYDSEDDQYSSRTVHVTSSGRGRRQRTSFQRQSPLSQRKRDSLCTLLRNLQDHGGTVSYVGLHVRTRGYRLV